MSVLLWTAIGFLAGALPFSVWLGRGLAGADVRAVGDGNPGAANAWKAGGARVGFLVLALDYFKGFVPVGLAHFLFGVGGWDLLPVALAPVLGHRFSPFLSFHGGKGLTVTFGIWSGVTLAEAPVVMGLLMAVFYFTLSVDAWAALAAMGGLLAYFVLRGAEAPITAIALGNLLLLAWTHRRELRRPPGLSARALRLLRRA